MQIFKDPENPSKTVFIIGNASPVDDPWNNQEYFSQLIAADEVMPYMSVHECQFKNAAFLTHLAIAHGADFIEFNPESHGKMMHAAYCYAKYARVDSTLDYPINRKQKTELVTEFKELEKDWKELLKPQTGKVEIRPEG